MEMTDYVSYDLALKLKAAGFNEPCDHCYAKTSESQHEFIGMTTSRDYNKPRDGEPPFLSPICSAPALWHAQKWLREKKKIDVLVYNCACGYLWEVSKATNGTGLILFDEKGDDENSGCWTSYEAALSAGIAAALELIKGGE